MTKGIAGMTKRAQGRWAVEIAASTAAQPPRTDGERAQDNLTIEIAALHYVECRASLGRNDPTSPFGLRRAGFSSV